MTPKCPDCKRDQDECVCVDLEAENAALRAEVARLSKLAYIGEHQFDDNTWKHRVNELRQQLATSQLEAKRLREALLLIKRETDIHGNSLNTPTRAKALKVLFLPTSTEALDAYVAEKVKEYELEFNQCSGLLDDAHRSMEKLEEQRNLAVSALEYHQSQTRPIENTMKALSTLKESET